MSKLLEIFRSPWILATVVILIAIMIRIGVSGSNALERGRISLDEGDTTMAVHHFREAVSWVLPVAPWREDAAEALWSIHLGQVESGQLKEAVQTLSMLRAGLMAGRSILGPDEVWHEKVDSALAPLMARWEAKAAVQEGRPLPGSLKEREAHFAQILARDTLPSRGYGLIAILGFFVWCFAVWRSTGATGKSRIKILGVAAVGFVLFVLGLTLA